jgi:hypothetical protein
MKFVRTICAVTVCILLATAISVSAGPKVNQDDVDTAIDKGAEFLVGYLKSGQKEVPHSDHHGTVRKFRMEPLILLTLLHAGNLAVNDPVLVDLVETVADLPNRYTYETVLKAMALYEYDPKKYHKTIADCGQFLVDTQCQNGQWSYGNEVPPVHEDKDEKEPDTVDSKESDKPDDKPKRSSRKKNGKTETLPITKIKKRGQGPPTGDNSNSQYAALGIRACIESGCDMPKKTLVLARSWWEKCQQSHGGWCYSTDLKDNVAYGSMTAGGLASVFIYDHYLKINGKKDKMCGAAATWLAQNFSVQSNPGHSMPDFYHYYQLYAIERAGILGGVHKFGSHDWYNEGADWLLKQQKSDGSWRNTGGTGMEGTDTCFAILFLRRATKPLPKVYSGPGRRNE